MGKAPGILQEFQEHTVNISGLSVPEVSGDRMIGTGRNIGIIALLYKKEQ